MSNSKDKQQTKWLKSIDKNLAKLKKRYGSHGEFIFTGEVDVSQRTALQQTVLSVGLIERNKKFIRARTAVFVIYLTIGDFDENLIRIEDYLKSDFKTYKGEKLSTDNSSVHIVKMVLEDFVEDAEKDRRPLAKKIFDVALEMEDDLFGLADMVDKAKNRSGDTLSMMCEQ